MKLPPQKSLRRRVTAYTLLEMLVAMGIGIVMLGMVATISVDTMLNFAAMGNYVNLADQNRNAMDVIGREVRDSNALVAFSTNNPSYLELSNSISGTITTLSFDINSNTLTMSKTGQTNRTLLTLCEYWTFSLYNRAPLITSNGISFYSSTNYLTGQIDPTRTKVINLTWKCTRYVLGTQLNSQSVQTAQVMLRNKVN